MQNCFVFIFNSLTNSGSFQELQYFASRRAAAVAASVSSSATPTLSASSANQAGLPPPPPPPTHQHEFHPAYRIPGYMEHLYQLQHHASNPSVSLHGKCHFSFI